MWRTPSASLSSVPVFRNVVWDCMGAPNTVGFTVPITIEQGAFASLKTIHLYMSIPNATSFLADEHFPSTQLLDLRVRVLECVSNDEVRQLLAVIASSCSNLKNLALILYPPEFARVSPGAPSPDFLDKATIDHIGQFKRLEALAVHHLVPTSSFEVELVQFLECLPALNSLTIIPRHDWKAGTPRRPHPSAFGWNTLVTLAQRFPQIHTLSLYLDLSRDASDLSWPYPLDGFPTFTLRSLNIGTTAFPTSQTAGSIAYKLVSLLRGKSQFSWGNKHKFRWGVPNPVYSEPSFEPELKRWGEVKKRLSFGVSVRNGVYHEAGGKK